MTPSSVLEASDSLSEDERTSPLKQRRGFQTET